MLTTSILTYKQADTTIHLVIVGSILLGISLGLFKKLSNANQLVGPRFLTVFMFLICLSFIMITPWFKYPHVAHQMRQETEM